MRKSSIDNISSFVFLLLGFSIAANIFISYWYIFVTLILLIILYAVLAWASNPTQNYSQKYIKQTPILPTTADEAEKSVLQALHRKVSEYETVAQNRFDNLIYHETDELQDLKDKLKSIRKELSDEGGYKYGRYCICSFNFPTQKLQFLPKSELIRHFSTYFNERCEQIIKRSCQEGLDKCKKEIALLADYMLCYLSIQIDEDYIALKIQEAELRYHISRIKEEQRQKEAEERKAQKDYERALRDAAKNEEKARQELEKQQEALINAASEQEKIKLQEKISVLEAKLQEALTLKERAMSMAQQTRIGYVYVISNVRSFGENVYKIGMTRRLEPMDRIKELSDASVPFAFDVHHMIYTDDAPKLEAQLHQRFTESRLNMDNYRKEFFRVQLAEITDTLKEFGVIKNK